jgi:RNA polymerase sigma-70 factor (ECF subfamily)
MVRVMLEDSEIISLFEQRKETGLGELSGKYGNYVKRLIGNILYNWEDTDECFNDVLYKLWNIIPPEKPKNFGVFLAKIARNMAINRYNAGKTLKKGGGQFNLAIDELEDTLKSSEDIQENLENGIINKVINDFLENLTQKQRMIFVKRYWGLYSIENIAVEMNIKPQAVKSLLFRLRGKLAKKLDKET